MFSYSLILLSLAAIAHCDQGPNVRSGAPTPPFQRVVNGVPAQYGDVPFIVSETISCDVPYMGIT